MHPFGGTPICPRCSRAVYAAEQIMGPGRKVYHKPCLTCTSCKKRLDSYNLVEHNQDPYCKTCHVKNFGTRDLRHANLPDRDDVLLSPPTSPLRAASSLPQTSPRNNAPSLPPRKTPPTSLYNGARAGSPTPIFKPTHSWSPKRTSFSGPPPAPSSPGEVAELSPKGSAPQKEDDEDWEPPTVAATPAHTGRGASGLPRTFGGSNPSCGKCGKTVYFAEQAKAIGKTYHRGCLRCGECNTLLDSTRLTEKDGEPFCKHCYGKLYGPAGNGYALLGKAGG
ncbi:hypothetical protein PHLGIDRAFT_102870 [Phlebiopsis gigantea 11061_1 CR5-6]|uniref:Cysteine-rich protein 1 n=1 Tax=Phlebiopsis gigantea (strain 11061_1 CR5-6) TaxID=745531 RepID=A0A0C3S2E3_PHLG1|nr:hypothetical protein PHLGIDRAFT_102870 [Phlebiopsis gigantea 11061_1 CR5-6]